MMSEASRQRAEEYRQRRKEEQASAVSWVLRCGGPPDPPPPEPPPEIGEKRSFVPAAFLNGGGGFDGALHATVTGRVVYVNVPHRWYCVEFPLGDYDPPQMGRECFKF